MSISVLISTPAKEVHEVEVSGNETIGSLYTKAATATELEEGTFSLHWDEGCLDNDIVNEVHQVGLVEGCNIELTSNRTIEVLLEELEHRYVTISKRCEKDPELLLIVNVSACKGELYLTGKEFPLSTRNIQFTDPEGSVTGIGRNFLCESSVKAIDLSHLYNTGRIGDFFMYNCRFLETIDLPECVQVVGAAFLNCCTLLASIDLASFKLVVSIGERFLSCCTGLQRAAVPLENLVDLGKNFMSDCSCLEDIDLSGLAALEFIDEYFLSGCSSLLTIALPSSIKVISYRFLYQCCSLATIDLSPLSTVRDLGVRFLEECTSLQTIDLSPLKLVSELDDSFMARCSALESVDISGMGGIVSIKDSFLCECVCLHTLIFPRPFRIEDIGCRFLFHCFSLSTMDDIPFKDVSCIGDDFLVCCPARSNFDLSQLKGL